MLSHTEIGGGKEEEEEEDRDGDSERLTEWEKDRETERNADILNYRWRK